MCDLDFYPMSLILKQDIDIIVIYRHTKYGVNRLHDSTVTAFNY